MKRFFTLAFFSIILLASCTFVTGKRVRGNGNIKTESRNEHGFENIDVSGAIDVYAKQDSVQSVKVEADENLQQYIEVFLDRTTLIIRPKRGYNLKSAKSIKVYVSGPSFRHFEASGACNIYSENKLSGSDEVYIDLSGASDIKMELKASKINVELSGASNVSLSGEAKDLRVDGSGACKIRCIGLMTENTYVDLSGAGNAEVYASVKLDVHVSGAADVKYKGNAAVSQDISGAGSVKKVE